MRLIDADALFPENRVEVIENDGEKTAQKIIERINSAPAIHLKTEMHAHFIGWEYDGYADGFPVYDTWVCSICGEEFDSEGEPPAFDYCPYCGAKMDGDPHDSC